MIKENTINDYCLYCNYVLSEKAVEELELQCTNCSYFRTATDDETLRYEKKNNAKFVIDFTTTEDIIEDEISNRIPINCKCGSKIGVSRIVGTDCQIIKLCINCSQNVN